MAKTTSVPKRKVSSAGSKALRKTKTAAPVKKKAVAKKPVAIRKPAPRKTVLRGKPAVRKTAAALRKTVKVKPTPRRGLRQAQSSGSVQAPDRGRELAKEISHLALSKKAFDVSVLELKELTSVADYFVLASGATDIQVRAICHAIEDGLRAKGVKPHHVEGMAGATWVLLDYVDVVVHIMQPRARDYYALEELWADAPKEEVKD